MKLKELLEVVRNGDSIYVFIWDTGKELYAGENLEFNKKLAALNFRTVLYIAADEYMMDSVVLRIGVK